MVTIMDRDTGSDEPHPPTGELADLLECERELAELHEQAREKARQRVARARAQAAQASAKMEASLDQEAERERTRIREELRTRIRTIHAEAAERATLFDNVSDERVEALADIAFHRLLSTEGRS
jgi:F0F1-type ATP synthase membrane subunit b/b'